MNELTGKIHVLVVDDSAVIRQVMTDVLCKDKSIIVDTAADPIFAMRHMEKQWPDVIVLDIEMPRMDGITFLKKIMSERPTPIVMCSSLTTAGARISIEAMTCGAVDVIPKPKAMSKSSLGEENKFIIQTIKSAAKAKNLKKTMSSQRARLSKGEDDSKNKNNPVPQKLSADAIISKNFKIPHRKTDKIIAIGTSTGGTQALETVLTKLPITCPGIVVVQHMPVKFTKAFADRLNGICAVNVCEATHGQPIIHGQVIIAPGGKHMTINRRGTEYFVEVVDGPLVNRHKPSVDVLFRSVAKFAEKNAMGIIMTGMGDDGAKGLKEMKEAGAHTIGQNEATCVVYGMPQEAFKVGAVDKQVPLQSIAAEIMKY